MVATSEQAHRLHVLEIVHPLVPLGFLAAILGLTMLSMQPVFLALSLTAATAFSLRIRGMKATGMILLWLVPFIVLAALINPLFSSIGSTELVRIGTKAVYWESVAYGACMGAMLASIILWFYNATQILTPDKILATLGKGLPTVGLMISMILRLVPRLVRQGQSIQNTAHATSIARPVTLRQKTAARLRVISVLMGWSMEDSLETADAMRARGWGRDEKRTSYQPYRFRTFDAVVSGVLIALVISGGISVWISNTQFRFYPTMTPLSLWWGYVPYALLMFLPLLLVASDDVRGRQER